MELALPLTSAKSAVQGPLTVIRSEEVDETGADLVSATTDTELFIRKVFESDSKKGCELLFRLYYQPLCTHASRFVYSKEIAEDLVADVFFTFWDTQAYESIQQSFRAYLFRSVRNRAYNYLTNEFKKLDSLEAAEQQEAATTDSPEPQMRFEELYHKVNQLVAGLPPQSRKVFIMHRFESRKAKDIAQELQLSVRTVEVHIAKALSIVRSGLKDQWFVIALTLWLKNWL